MREDDKVSDVYMDFLVDGRPLTNRNAREILDDRMIAAFGDLSSIYNFYYCFVAAESSYLDFMDGRTTIVDDGWNFEVNGVRICIPDELSDTAMLDNRAFDNVDAYNFVGTMVAVFHEYHHVKQFLYDMWQSMEIGKIVNIDRFVLQSNDVYYSQNYFQNFSEIDAQYVGLYATQAFLSDLVGEQQANEYICYYQNKRQENLSRDFIPKIGRDYMNADEVFNEFKIAIHESVHSKRIYDRNIGWQRGDTAANFFMRHPEFWRQFEAENDGFKQDCMIVCACFEEGRYGDALRDRLERNTGLNFSVDAVFREDAKQRSLADRPLPDLQYDVSDRLHKDTTKML